MEKKIFRTPLKEKRLKRDLAVYSDYLDLMSVPEQSATEVCRYLMQKYEINSVSTIYVIVKRMKAYQKEEMS